jgi:Carbon storage regulator (could also regulate swarming and quorum sensing)
MLVITRKSGESIIIETEHGGQPIEIKIIQAENQVKIGISAPKNCKIWRNELYKTIEMNRQAADSSMGGLRGLKDQLTARND